nr:MAG TPA: hypothetical protein [Caudoviricetes sp.]
MTVAANQPSRGKPYPQSQACLTTPRFYPASK